MGPDFLTENAEEEEFIFGLVATEVLGAWDWILLFSVDDVGDRLDPDDDHPRVAHGALDGPAPRAAAHVCATSTRGSAPRTSRPGGSP